MKKYIPTLFTCGNAVCGLLSIIKTTQGSYVLAAWLIVLAALMDAVDGKVARALGMSTAFGKELDSLADVVSFCVAPAVLMYGWYGFWIGGHSTVVLIALCIYLCAGLFRLARFNILEKDQTVFFVGLPTPIGAFFLIQFVLYQHALTGVAHFLGNPLLLSMCIVAVALLFISEIQFYAFKSIALQSKTAVWYLKNIAALAAIGVCGWFGYPMGLIAIVLYMLGSVVYWLR